MLRSFKSDAVLAIFTDSNRSRSVPSLAHVDPTDLLWAPGASQAAMDVVERKEAKRRARMTPGKIDLQREKT